VQGQEVRSATARPAHLRGLQALGYDVTITPAA